MGWQANEALLDAGMIVALPAAGAAIAGAGEALKAARPVTDSALSFLRGETSQRDQQR